jgi:hypothetical protein
VDTIGEGPRIAAVGIGVIAGLPAAGYHHDRRSTTTLSPPAMSWDTKGWPE